MKVKAHQMGQLRRTAIFLSLSLVAFSCSKAKLNLKDRDALMAYLHATHFSCNEQGIYKKGARDQGRYMTLRFTTTQRETTSDLSESTSRSVITFFDSKGREKDASTMQFSIADMYKSEGRGIELTGASSSFSHMVLTEDGDILLYLAPKEWDEAGVQRLRFLPEEHEARTNESVRNKNRHNTPSSTEGAVLFDRAQFEEIFIGKPESFVRERLGEPAKWDLNGPFYKDGEQVFRKVVRYDRLVYSESPDQVIPSVILKYDKDQGGNVTRVEYKY